MKDTIISFRIPLDMLKDLDKHAESIGVTRSSFIKQLIAEELDYKFSPAKWEKVGK